jgi:energy-converting hydrogenase Eha subunit F
VAFIMNEIRIILTLALIFAIFIALVVFYGLVFWHWWNDAKSRYMRPSK